MKKLTSRQLSIVVDLMESYTALQKYYMQWAANFSEHDDVIRYLEEEQIKRNRIGRQTTLNLHSRHWNRITTSVIEKLAPGPLKVMRDGFYTLLNVEIVEDWRRMWHWLFFIHPVRHELYYFDSHYPFGYKARLSRLLCRNGAKLERAERYIEKIKEGSADYFSGETIGKNAFKHLLLHPTTEHWKLGSIDVLDCIHPFDFSQKEVSKIETDAVLPVGHRRFLQFDEWLSYASCAINEGPIFSAKAGVSPMECFREIIERLRADHSSQLVLREVLQKYFDIEEVARM